MSHSFVINLPFPPSVNDANRIGKNKRTGRMQQYPSPAKAKFNAEANGLYLMQSRHVRNVPGPFTYHITLNEAMRRPLMDGDNRGKYVLDFLQSVGLIDDDKFAAGGSWSWGPSDEGCTVIVKEFVSNRVPVSHQTESANDSPGRGQ
jgi:Holliday junction resolvase RusA-like endonuclease